MVSKDFKQLLKTYAVDLFDLNAAMEALKFHPAYQPLLRYYRGQQSDSEFYWCADQKTAPLEIVWATPYGAPSLQPPAEVQAKAIVLLHELNDKRELVALYRCGHIEGDRFILSSWPIPFPSSYKKGDGDGSGVYYTITCNGELGLAFPYTDNKELYAVLV
jgi:hypothetical protein